MSFERKVGLGFVLAALVQLAAAFAWAGASTQRIAAVEATLARQEDMPERLARIEAQLDHVSGQLGRVETQLFRVEEKLGAR